MRQVDIDKVGHEAANATREVARLNRELDDYARLIAGRTASGQQLGLDAAAIERTIEPLNKALEAIKAQRDEAEKLRATNTKLYSEAEQKQKAVLKLQEDIKISVRATTAAFESLSGAILGSVIATQSGAWHTFIGSFGLLSGEIGQVFIPTIAKISASFQDVAHWFKNLDESTKDSIRYWGEWALIVTAGGFALSRVISITYGVKEAIVATYAVIAAHPFVVLTTVILSAAAAAYYFSGAFRTITEEVEQARQQIQALQAVLSRLQGGGALSKSDIDKLSAEDALKFRLAGDDKGKQREALKEIENQANIRLGNLKNAAEEAAVVREALGGEGWKKFEVKGGAVGAEARRNAVVDALQKKLGYGEGRAAEIADPLYKAGAFSPADRWWWKGKDAEAAAERVRQPAEQEVLRREIARRGIEQLDRGKAIEGAAGQRDARKVPQAPGQFPLEWLGNQIVGLFGATPRLGNKEPYAYSRPQEIGAGFSPIEQARRTFQIAALSVDPIQQQQLDVARRGFDAMIAELQRLNQRGDGRGNQGKNFWAGEW